MIKVAILRKQVVSILSFSGERYDLVCRRPTLRRRLVLERRTAFFRLCREMLSWSLSLYVLLCSTELSFPQLERFDGQVDVIGAFILVD